MLKLGAMKWLFVLMSFLVGLKSEGRLLQEDEKKTKVFVMEIKAEIDPRMNHYVELALEEAVATRGGPGNYRNGYVWWCC